MIIVQEMKIPALSGDAFRRVYVYLPDSYQTETERRYPVLYMFDGHNVFFDQDVTYGESLGMEQYMQDSNRQLIIVAVESNRLGNCRLEEYAPFDFTVQQLGSFSGKGKMYMDWLVGTLKPWIDRSYRTMPDRKHTALCGSSMGGLMALYGVVAYNHVFLQAACLSPSLWIKPERVLKMLSDAHFDAIPSIYMDYGSDELVNHDATEQTLEDSVRLLKEKGANVHFQIVPGGTHCEASWKKRIPHFVDALKLAVTL